MKIRISKKPDILQIMTFYIFGVLYLQILGMWLPFSITKPLVLVLLVQLFVGIVNRSIKASLVALSTVVVGVIYFLYYILKVREIVSYVYPAIIVSAIALLLADNLSNSLAKYDWRRFNKLLMGYLVLNLAFYLLKVPASFQVAGSQLQFKGPLPHTNMFASVLQSFYILLFWQKTRRANINKFLILILMLTTMSRTYMLTLLACVFINYIAFIRPRMTFATKLVAIGIGGVIIAPLLFSIAIEVIPAFARFKTFGFGGNGRQYLQESYFLAIKNGSLLDKLLGFPMVRPYLDGIAISFPHSFTECSFMGIYLQFGIFGIICWGTFIYKLLKRGCSGPAMWILAISCASLLMQDTLLSVQTGILFVISIVYMFSDHRKEFSREMCI